MARPPRRRATAPIVEGFRWFARLAAGTAVVATVAAVAGTPARELPAAPTDSRSGAFAWFVPTPAPAAWNRGSPSASPAAFTLAYPPSFTPVAGDPGTVSAGVRDGTGPFRAYLNVTPRQGDEQPRGFARFRVRLLGGEHDQSVHEEAAAERLAFQEARGSCVLDDYVTRVGHHRYREIACFVLGRRSGAVIVAAATTAAWDQFQPLLREAIEGVVVP